ncbi:MAG: TonB-dependent receptor [Acidobacteria bacterium]|nr:TonB-dependent receptor [Acidobacteriota bacterium]
MRTFLLTLVLAVLTSAGSAFAQTTGAIRGTVKDPSGAVVVGAKVDVTLEGTGAGRSAATNERGEFDIPALPVGHYTLGIEVSGFKKFLKRDIELNIGHVVVVEAMLELGSPNEVVTAEAGVPLIETTNTQLGAVVNERAATGLPLNARDTYQLLQLQPGVQSTQDTDLFYGSDRPGVVSVNGGRGRSNNFMVNGGDGNDQFVNLPAIQPSPDTIEEFRVLTNTFDAEYGRNSGAVINVVTKSGTNRFHGNVFEFFRNKVLNARGFFDTQKPDFKQNQFGFTFGGPIKKDRTFFFGSYEGRRVRQGKPSDTVTVPTLAERGGNFSSGTTFAGTLTDATVAAGLNARPGCAAAIAAQGGAPIAAGSPYGATRDPVTNAILIPGIFTDALGNRDNIIPVVCFDATALDLMNQFVPLPNSGSTFQAAPIRRENASQFTLKIDHKISNSQQFSAYFYLNNSLTKNPFARFQAGGASLPGFGDVSDERVQQWNLSHTWTIGQTAVNELRFAYFREGQGTFLHPQRTNPVKNSCATVPAAQCFSDSVTPALGITPGLGGSREGVPFVNISGGFSIGNNFQGELPQVGNTFHWTDNFSKVWGSHSLKFGGDVRRQRFDQFLYFDVNGQFNFFGAGPNDIGFDNLFPNYLLGLPDFYLQGSAQQEKVRSTSLYLFAQDSWKIKPNLTLNYGLRWELNTPIADVGHRVQTFRPGQDTAIYPCQLTPGNPLIGVFGTNNCGPSSAGQSVFPRGLLVPGDRGIPGGLTQTYFKSFAPRIGLAWSPGWKDGWLAKLSGGPGKTSVRMGWGIFYNPVEQLVLEQFSAEPPFGGSSGLSNTFFNTPFLFQDGTVAPNPFGGVLNPPRGQPVDWSRFRPILLFGQFQPDMRSQYSVQYNLTIQRQLWKDVVLQVGYVGSQGHRLLATHDLNFGNPQTCKDLASLFGTGNPAYAGLDCGPFFADSSYGFVLQPGDTLTLPNGNRVTGGAGGTPIGLVGLRKYSSPLCDPLNGWDPIGGTFINGCPPDGVPVFSSIFAQDTIANANYNSMQVLLEKRFSKGLQLSGAYTWSKSIDNASSFENILNPVNYRASRSLSLFDARHRFVLSYVWELPFRTYHGARGVLLNGWMLSGIVTFQSGFPIRITSADDLELMNSFDFELPGQPNQVKPFRKLDPRGPGNFGFDPTAFVSQAFGTIGNAPRAVCCGPGANNFDMAFMKTTRITENTRVEFRAEFFNIWNHAQFTNPSGNITDGPDFGRVKRARDPRLIQFALKLFF